MDRRLALRRRIGQTRMDSRKGGRIKIERRAKPRVVCAFSALVRGYGDDGKKFQETATLSNLSACGLYLRMNKAIEPGSLLFVVIYLADGSQKGTPGARIAVHGPVVRAQPEADGCCSLAVEFNRNRFLET